MALASSRPIYTVLNSASKSQEKTQMPSPGLERWCSGQRHLPHKSSNWISISGVQRKIEKTDSTKLPTDFSLHATPCAPAYYIMRAHMHTHKRQDLGLVKVQNSSISSCFNGRVSHGWSDLQRKFPLWALLACFPSILLSSGLPEERTLTSPRDGFPPPEASMGHFKYRQRPCGPGWVS